MRKDGLVYLKKVDKIDFKKFNKVFYLNCNFIFMIQDL